MGILLFIISVILIVPLFVVSVTAQAIYFLVTLKWKTGAKQVSRFFKAMAISLDRFGNISCAFILNGLFVKKGGMLHGDSRDVASYVIGRNKYKKKLTILGLFIVWLLNLLEKNHVEIAIKEKIENDKEACRRVGINKYFE